MVPVARRLDRDRFWLIQPKPNVLWGSLLAFAATIYGIYAITLPCGFIQDLHNGLSSFLTLFGAFLAFMGRTTASQPIHFFWRYQAEVLDL